MAWPSFTPRERSQPLAHGGREQAGVGGDGEPFEALLEPHRDIIGIRGRARWNATLETYRKRPGDELLRRGAVAECLRQIALSDEHRIDAGDLQDAFDVLHRFGIFDHRHAHDA